jgi:cytochrome c oxidase subunit IV
MTTTTRSITRRAAEAAGQHLGLQVIALLAVLTAWEYVIAVEVSSVGLIVLLLSVMAVGKAAAIIAYFMHLPKAWHGEEEHE